MFRLLFCAMCACLDRPLLLVKCDELKNAGCDIELCLLSCLEQWIERNISALVGDSGILSSVRSRISNAAIAESISLGVDARTRRDMHESVRMFVCVCSWWRLEILLVVGLKFLLYKIEIDKYCWKIH